MGTNVNVINSFIISSSLLLSSCSEKESNKNRIMTLPNIIIINIDDLGYGDIEPFGSVLNRTPNLTNMSNEGVRLTSFYAEPVSTVSRAALMTGCIPKRVLPIAQNVLYPGDSIGLHTQEITIAEMLKERGYKTGIIGKWHLGDQPEFLPTRQGFDYYFGIPYSNDMGPVEDGARNHHGYELGKPPSKAHVWGEGYPPIPYLRNEKFVQVFMEKDQQECVERYTHEAIEFIKKNQNNPFFLYLAHTAVHYPLHPGKSFLGKSDNGLYGDWVEEVDWSVGKILKTIKRMNIDEETVVIFTSDNGGASIGSNAPLRGYKGSVWEGGIRVPFIARWPKKIPAGTQRDAISGMIDVLPTLAEISGANVPKDRTIDGKSIWPILSGKLRSNEHHEVYYHYRALQLRAIRYKNWKYHLLKGELYDLSKDIGETNDVAGSNMDVVKHINLLADKMDRDLGKGGPTIFKGIGPNSRKLGQIKNAKLIVDKNRIVDDFFKINANSH